jgi:glycine oxidase
MNEQDYIIVGQGIAGSVLAYFLRKNGQKVVVIDRNTEGVLSSSKIAAGVINPITGRRFVKSWRIDELLPFAKQTYQELEKVLKISIWHDRRIIRTLRDIEEENNFLLRRTYPDYEFYCGETTPLPRLSDENASLVDASFINHFHSFADIKNGAQVNVPFLIEHFRTYFIDNQCFINNDFSFSDLIIEENGVTYKNIKAEKIIFAEGAAGATNPYFSWLPFNLDKGELLLVRIPNLKLRHIFKNKISIVPLHDIGIVSKMSAQSPKNTEGGHAEDLYWVGATNAWTFDDDQPSENNKLLIINELREILNCPFEIIGHQAAVRPTVRDRRPFIGLHPKFPVLGIFNGFGTKGASLVPFFAARFVDSLLKNLPLEREVDISRFPPV